MIIMNIRSVDELKSYLLQGRQVEYLFFWGHRKVKSGISKACFSQWFEASFTVENTHYATAEHYMMAAKARLFNDTLAEQNILKARSSGEAKKLGRAVENFDESVWQQARFAIVVDANLAKFGQNEALREFLLNTGDKVIVEASPVDKIWGIGLEASDPKAQNPDLWLGENLLGFALMEVRARLASE